jgi:hypothetical protein
MMAENEWRTVNRYDFSSPDEDRHRSIAVRANGLPKTRMDRGKGCVGDERVVSFWWS